MSNGRWAHCGYSVRAWSHSHASRLCVEFQDGVLLSSRDALDSRSRKRIICTDGPGGTEGETSVAIEALALRCVLGRGYARERNGARQPEAGLDPERSESYDHHRLAKCQAVAIIELTSLTDFLLGASRAEHPIAVLGGCLVLAVC